MRVRHPLHGKLHTAGEFMHDAFRRILGAIVGHDHFELSSHALL